MLQIIIFSFNRAIQLDALIASYKRYWKTSGCKIDVVYNTSSADFQRGYDKLIEIHASDRDIEFHKEHKAEFSYTCSELANPYNLRKLISHKYLRHPRTDFRPLVNSLMKQSPMDMVMFMTDDSVFIEDVVIPEGVFEWIREAPSKRQFSLRIGEGMNNQPAKGVALSGDLLEWNMGDMPKDTNWGYQFSVDAHIYSKERILRLYETYLFCNPNSLEGYLCNMIRRREWFNEAKAFKHAKLLSFPINMVQQVEDNESMGVSTEMMNDYYLKGYSLEYRMPPVMDAFQVYPDEIYFYKGSERIVMRICNT